MSKAMIVIDMPESCRECPLCREEHMTYRDYCCLANMRIWTIEKPDWCPLRELPEEELIWYEDEGSDYERGYNACLDEILRGDMT